MNLNHLIAFEKVVQLKSFQEAAKYLSVSQPAISLRIQALEEYFSTKLVMRTAEGVQLTPQGEMIYAKVKEILRMWRELENQVKSEEPVGKLVLGASTIPSEYVLPKIIKAFKGEYPKVDFSMKISGSKDVVSWLNHRSVDVAITGEPANNPLLYSIPILNEHLSIIAPDGLFEDCEHQLHDLLESDWILREKNSDTRASLEKTFESLGYKLDQLKIVGELGSTEAVIAAVEAGLGVSVVSSYAAERASHYGRVKVINCNDFDVTRSFYFSCLNENKSHPLISAFLTFIQTYLKK